MGKIMNVVVAAMVVLALFGAVPVLADEPDASEAAQIMDKNCVERSGAGWALLAGTGKMTFKGKGFIVVLGETPKIETDGNGVVRRITPEVTVYRGRGKITVKGEKIAVYLRGEGHLRACGEGFADWGHSGFE